MVSDDKDKSRGEAAHRPTPTPPPFLFLVFIILFGKHQLNTTLYLLLHAPMPAGIVVAIFS